MNYSPEQAEIIQAIEAHVKECADPVNLDIKAHDWKHAFRVRNWALKIAKGEEYKNTFLAEIASLLHDIGRLKEKELKRPHAQISGEMAQEYLAPENWLSQEKLKEVIYAIANHSKGGDSQLVHILQDADRLDGFGAMGLIRTLQPKWYLPDYDPIAIVNPFALSKKEIDAHFSANPQKDIVSYAIDHIAYVATWYNQMNTKKGKELATPLVEYTKAFLEEVKREVTF